MTVWEYNRRKLLQLKFNSINWNQTSIQILLESKAINKFNKNNSFSFINSLIIKVTSECYLIKEVSIRDSSARDPIRQKNCVAEWNADLYYVRLKNMNVLIESNIWYWNVWLIVICAAARKMVILSIVFIYNGYLSECCNMFGMCNKTIKRSKAHLSHCTLDMYKFKNYV